jgi:hypothetical protein
MRRFGICVLVLALFLPGCARQDDVAFSRRVLEGLVQDRYAVRSLIDWQHLKMLGKDIGEDIAKYAKTDKDRRTYEIAFIEGFSKTFRMQGAKLNAFFDWHIYKGEKILDLKNPKDTIVAANCFDKQRLFLFVVSHEGGKQKLTEIEVQILGLGGKTDVAPAQP